MFLRLNFIRLFLLVLLVFANGGSGVEGKYNDLDWDRLKAMGVETPILNTNPGEEYLDANRNYNMTIGITRTAKGRLWAVWVSGGDSDKGYFVLATSDDDGKTWSKPRLVIDPTESPDGILRRTLVGAIWTDPQGRVFLFFDQSMGYYDARDGVWMTRCDDPDSETPHWSEPKRIADGATLQKPTILSSGEWLLPVSLWERKMCLEPFRSRKDLFAELDSRRGANVYVSTNQGDSWQWRGFVHFPYHNFDEHIMIELKDGRIWMTARTSKGIYQSFSSDRGITWSKPTVFGPHTVSRFFTRRLQSGRILFVRHGSFDGSVTDRSMLTAYLSEDEGKSWKGGLVLDERKGVSYPDGIQAPDGRIFISYDRERGGAAEILMSIFTEEDILAGKIVSESGTLKRLVSKAEGPKPKKKSKAIKKNVKTKKSK